MALVDMSDPATIADMVAVLINEAAFPEDADEYSGLSLAAWAEGQNVMVMLPNPVEIYPHKIFKLSTQRVDHGFPLPTTPPSLGDPVGRGLRNRTASQARADYWTLQLADDPVYGESSGFAVGVAPQADDDGTWPLIWVTSPA